MPHTHEAYFGVYSTWPALHTRAYATPLHCACTARVCNAGGPIEPKQRRAGREPTTDCPCTHRPRLKFVFQCRLWRDGAHGAWSGRGNASRQAHADHRVHVVTECSRRCGRGVGRGARTKRRDTGERRACRTGPQASSRSYKFSRGGRRPEAGAATSSNRRPRYLGVARAQWSAQPMIPRPPPGDQTTYDHLNLRRRASTHAACTPVNVRLPQLRGPTRWELQLSGQVRFGAGRIVMAERAENTRRDGLGPGAHGQIQAADGQGEAGPQSGPVTSGQSGRP